MVVSSLYPLGHSRYNMRYVSPPTSGGIARTRRKIPARAYKRFSHTLN